MQTVTQTHTTQVSIIMLQLLATFCTLFVQADSTAEDLATYTADVAHNLNALQMFCKTKNVSALYNAIKQQDTLVREHFNYVLTYLEDEDLVCEECF